MTTRTIAIGLAVTLFLFCFHRELEAAAPVVEDWDNGALGVNGWVGNTTSSVVVYSAAGGNPDGYILARRAGTFDIGALIDAPPATDFHGDYGAAGIRRASVDLQFQQGTFTGAWIRFRSGAGVNGWRFPLTNVFPVNTWTTYNVNFDPIWSNVDAIAAGWIQEDVTSPTFASTLANVDTAEARVAGSSTSLLVGIDNFVLAVPEPAACLLLLVASVIMVTQRPQR